MAKVYKNFGGDICQQTAINELDGYRIYGYRLAKELQELKGETTDYTPRVTP